MLSLDPTDSGSSYRDYAVQQLASQGPVAVGSIYWTTPPEVTGNPANRMFRPPSVERSALSLWIKQRISSGDDLSLQRAGIDDHAIDGFFGDDSLAFIRAREASLRALETRFQIEQGVTPSSVEPAEAPVDTD